MIFLEFEAASHRIEREHNDRAWLAWHVAALSRTKRLPKIQTLMIRRKRQPQTWQDQLAICKMITAYYGGARNGG